jgi:predicted RNA-binding Zn ribbon-like protein
MGTFPLTGEPLAVDLANTVVAGPGGPRDLLAEEAAVRAWLDLHGVGDAPAAELRRLRDALRAVFQAVVDGTEPSAGSLRRINEASAAAVPALRWERGVPVRRWRSAGGRGEAPATAVIAHSATELLATGAGQLRRCGGPGCLLFFVATHPRRQWCSSQLCGNRVRVARHRGRATPA